MSSTMRGESPGDGGYTQINVAVFKDPRLSIQAKGLFGLLATHPDGRGLSVEAICAQSKEGPTAAKSTLRELEKFGYLTRRKQQDESGRWCASRYEIPEHLLGDRIPSQWGPDVMHGPLDTSGWAYAVTEDANGLVKIGKAQDVGSRVRTMQSGSAAKLTVVWSAPGGHALECYLHDVFESRRVRGEWFDFSGVDAVELISGAASRWRNGER